MVGDPNYPSISSRVSRSITLLKHRSPFFATLAMFATIQETLDLPTAATDGVDIFLNPIFMGNLNDEEFDGVFMHEILHAAMAHVPRRAGREPQRWNIAADIVVNGVLIENDFVLPKDHIRDEALEHYSVEEVYALLPVDSKQEQEQQDLLPMPNSSKSKSASDKGGSPAPGKSSGQPQELPGALGEKTRAEIEKKWKEAVRNAEAVNRGAGKGELPLSTRRSLGLEGEPKLDWKTLLWRHLVPTQSDFEGFDRRHLGRGLYLENLESSSLRVYVCVDTSGSVDDGQMQIFLNEVRGILGAYPSAEGFLFYADTEVSEAHPFSALDPFPAPTGGGGTSFFPFFEKVAALHSQWSGGICVYLTDGYGDFPEEAPTLPTLWVVSTGGLPDSEFPFGEVARME